MSDKLVKVEIDEIELYLNLLKQEIKLDQYTSSEIAEMIRINFNIECTEQDIFLLHEPTIIDPVYETICIYKDFI